MDLGSLGIGPVPAYRRPVRLQVLTGLSLAVGSWDPQWVRGIFAPGPVQILGRVGFFQVLAGGGVTQIEVLAFGKRAYLEVSILLELKPFQVF
jgi:hypothetical protein